MKPEVLIINTNSCNLHSVMNAFANCGANVTVSTSADAIANAKRVVLPGVGAFKHCMESLQHYQLTQALLDYIQSNRPFLGICLGMQLMLQQGHEHGPSPGLGIIEGDVVSIEQSLPTSFQHKIPHIGWYPLKVNDKSWGNTILSSISPNDSVYFIHSYMAQPKDPHHVIASYQVDHFYIPAVIQKGNAYGCQFHPEKSGPVGQAIIKQFLNL